MRGLDKAQRKLFADFLEKFALALATAVSAKIFFAEEQMTLLTLCAAIVMLMSFVLILFLVHGTEEKPDGVKQKPVGEENETLRYEEEEIK